MRADLVCVFHNDVNHQQSVELLEQLRAVEPDGGFTFAAVDNRYHNRGFAAGCNLGALHPELTAPVIGFLNPDVRVDGPFIAPVAATLDQGGVVITGCRFGKADRELKIWGVHDWVCGAALFVTRPFFEQVGGFDEQFVWAWEESDLIRQAQKGGFRCQSISLPIHHESPHNDSRKDAEYKNLHFERGARRYRTKWGMA